ncbi:MAG: monooxygenase, partial [Sporichthyaceae bacterium]
MTAAASLCLLLMTACGAGNGGRTAPQAGTKQASTPSATTSSPTASGEPSSAPLRAGERFLDLPMPDGAYSPVAPRGGKDEYRCFLLDPALTADTFVTGAQVLPGREEIVHHAIIFRVGPGEVAMAQQADQGDPGTGWTCFGGTAFPGRGGANAVSALDSAPWLSAWAPGGGENVFGAGTGVLLAARSRLIMQVHYNLRNGVAPDDSGLRLRLADGHAHLAQLQTMLLVGPVELPCAKGETGPLCDRESAVLDLMQRFGSGSGATVAGLQLLCDGNVLEPRAGPTQRCDRRVSAPMMVRAAAGHMHLLGRSIKVELNPGTP